MNCLFGPQATSGSIAVTSNATRLRGRLQRYARVARTGRRDFGCHLASTFWLQDDELANGTNSQDLVSLAKPRLRSVGGRGQLACLDRSRSPDHLRNTRCSTRAVRSDHALGAWTRSVECDSLARQAEGTGSDSSSKPSRTFGTCRHDQVRRILDSHCVGGGCGN